MTPAHFGSSTQHLVMAAITCLELDLVPRFHSCPGGIEIVLHHDTSKLWRNGHDSGSEAVPSRGMNKPYTG